LLLTPAKQLGVPFIETSAKTGHNVQEAFLILTRLLQEAAAPVSRPPAKASSGCGCSLL